MVVASMWIERPARATTKRLLTKSLGRGGIELRTHAVGQRSFVLQPALSLDNQLGRAIAGSARSVTQKLLQCACRA